MKNKHNNIFWVLFLVWVLVYGTLQCGGQLNQANPDCHRDSVAGHFCSQQDNLLSRSGLIPLGLNNRDIACQNPLCRPVGSLLTGSGNTLKPVTARPRYSAGPFMDQDHRSNPFFARHEIKQPVSIYTIVQSFLC